MIGPNGGLMTQDCYKDFCCDPPCLPCCAKLSEVNGRQEFNENGQMVIDTGTVIWTITMPTADSDIICPGDEILIEGVLKAGTYSFNSPYYPWVIHHDRAWDLVDYGNDVDPPSDIESESFVSFQTEEPEAFGRFEYIECFADWDGQYGKIHFRSVENDESLDLILTSCETSDEEDCCPCEFECKPCCWYFVCDLPEPDRPEVVNGVISYYTTGPHGWEMKVEIDLDPYKRRVCRDQEEEPTGVGIKVILLPPPDYDDYNSPQVSVVYRAEHPGWVSEANETEPDPCAETTSSDPTNELEYDFSLSVIDCDSPCDLADPETIVISATITPNHPTITADFVMSLDLQVAACPNPDNIDCGCEYPCCPNPEINITHAQGANGYEIDSTPKPGYFASGYVCVPDDQTRPGCTKHLWYAECYPTEDSEDTIHIFSTSELGTAVAEVFGSVPSDDPICLDVDFPENGEVYTICITCPEGT